MKGYPPFSPIDCHLEVQAAFRQCQMFRLFVCCRLAEAARVRIHDGGIWTTSAAALCVLGKEKWLTFPSVSKVLLPLYSGSLKVSHYIAALYSYHVLNVLSRVLYKNQYLCLTKSWTGVQPFVFSGTIPASVAKAERGKKKKNLEQ